MERALLVAQSFILSLIPFDWSLSGSVQDFLAQEHYSRDNQNSHVACVPLGLRGSLPLSNWEVHSGYMIANNNLLASDR